MPSTLTIAIFAVFMLGVVLVAVALPWLGMRQEREETGDVD